MWPVFRTTLENSAVKTEMVVHLIEGELVALEKDCIFNRCAFKPHNLSRIQYDKQLIVGIEINCLLMSFAENHICCLDRLRLSE